MNRKKKLRLIQFFLLFLGIMIFIVTYTSNNKDLISSKLPNKQLDEEDEESDGNIFYNIEYSGIDLAGNRYTLKSEKAKTNQLNDNVIDMFIVNAVFYFKDETILKIKSNTAEYNNITLDIKFREKIFAEYEKSTLKAEYAEYSNSLGFLYISDNVIIKDVQGNLSADKLKFDISDQTLRIESFNNDKISVNVNTDEKRF